jgi:hypothetical protein
MIDLGTMLYKFIQRPSLPVDSSIQYGYDPPGIGKTQQMTMIRIKSMIEEHILGGIPEHEVLEIYIMKLKNI